jgi:hypothetical protein
MIFFAVAFASLHDNINHIEVIQAASIEEALIEKLKRHGYIWDYTWGKSYRVDAEGIISFAFDCDVILNAVEIPLNADAVILGEVVSEPSYKIHAEEAQDRTKGAKK